MTMLLARGRVLPLAPRATLLEPPQLLELARSRSMQVRQLATARRVMGLHRPRTKEHRHAPHQSRNPDVSSDPRGTAAVILRRALPRALAAGALVAVCQHRWRGAPRTSASPPTARSATSPERRPARRTGTGSVAIAHGDGSDAEAIDGDHNHSMARGEDSIAYTGGGDHNTAHRPRRGCLCRLGLRRPQRRVATGAVRYALAIEGDDNTAIARRRRHVRRRGPRRRQHGHRDRHRQPRPRPVAATPTPRSPPATAAPHPRSGTGQRLLLSRECRGATVPVRAVARCP